MLREIFILIFIPIYIYEKKNYDSDYVFDNWLKKKNDRYSYDEFSMKYGKKNKKNNKKKNFYYKFPRELCFNPSNGFFFFIIILKCTSNRIILPADFLFVDRLFSSLCKFKQL